MEGVPEPAPRPGRKRTVLLVLVVGTAVALSGFVVWWELVRVRSITEVLAFDHFQPGTAVTVQGTITGIYRENTSYGPKVFLALDHEPQCNTTGQVFGDPNDTYVVGQTFETTLHFESASINGDPAVFAPELACPFPSGFEAVQDVLDTVSTLQGIRFVYNGSEPGGWEEYRIFTHNNESLNPSVLPAFLVRAVANFVTSPALPAGGPIDSAARWNALLSAQYIGAVVTPNREFPLVDQMDSLVDGTSVNGSLRYIDVNGDRMLDDGDHFDVRLPSTSATAWNTFIVQIGSPIATARTYVGGMHFILTGPDGPLDPLLSSLHPMVDLAYLATQPGPPVQSTIQVASVRIGAALPLAAIHYSLTINTAGSQFSDLYGNLTSLPMTTGTGVTLSLEDLNHDSLLDSGDRFTVTGAENQSELSLNLFGPAGGLGYLGWIVGFGPILGPVALPAFTVQGSNPWTIGLEMPLWSPELALNRTVRATLYENSSAVVTNASLVNGTIGTFAGGSLSFTDADGNGYLSTGDYFILSGNPMASYRLDLVFFFGGVRFSSPYIPGP